MLNSSWVDDYVNWLKKQYEVNKLSNSDEIITPFTNSIGDNITIYVSSNPDNSITLTDDFDTIGDLEMMGVDISIPTRKNYIKNIIKDYQVNFADGEIYVTGDKEDFPAMKQALIQAIIHIDDLLMTRKSNITNIFKEEVYNYFDKNDFGGLKTYRPDGSSGNSYVIDYTIPQRGTKPYRFINFTNNSSFATIATSGAMYGDISSGEEYNLTNSEFIIIYNSEQANPSTKSINIANQYKLKLISWNDKKEILSIK
ncbi:DUF1828 domain-containing protein [Companilactobacillus farciminis]|uniref:DUF1828 domain-containing protein n=1 Tax=Companilactobacillus farciminis TaxID=1612 RepID=UPI00232B5980|nr:DUF1828 domain-containing protein [Companilactobacillus farciminis]WCG35856.1 DUF1828 domain-containing protein [Companilactobacillus farciminis]